MKAGEKHRAPRRLIRRAIVMPALETVITCPACGSEVDLWTDEDETRCLACDQEICKKQRLDH